jgi:hypothetical protein
MNSRNKKEIVRAEAKKATENEGRSHGDGSETGISTPISRRGLFAALAVAAGLGILSSNQAYALAAQNFGRGQWIGNKWVNGYISGAITHPHLQRGVNDYFFGKSTNNGAWNATANGSQSGVFFFFLRRRGGSTCRAGCAEWRGGALRPLPDVLPAAGLPDVPVVPAAGRGAAFAA